MRQAFFGSCLLILLAHGVMAAEVDPPSALGHANQWDMDGMGYTSSDDTPVLKHTETAYYFQILTPDNFRIHGFRGRVSPGASSNEFMLKEDVAWERMVELFNHWLGWLKRELAVADPWAALEQQRVLAPTLVAYNQTANRPFTVVEAKTLETTLGQLVEKIEEVFPDVVSKVTNIGLQVQSLVLAAQEGRGRIDWANQFVGFLLQVFLLLAASSEQARLIWSFVKGSLGSGMGLFLP